MPRVLLLFAHPALDKSRAHRRLAAEWPALRARLPGLTVHDLYEAYPDYDVDVAREQALLAAHDVVLFQFPFYWYSTPPLLKQWEDLVLEHGWAYGRTGRALEGKRCACLLTAGGRAEAYRPEGSNRFTVRQLLAPLEQTAHLCRMTWLPPWVLHGTHRLEPAGRDAAAARYAQLLTAFHDGDLGAHPDDSLGETIDAALDRALAAREARAAGVGA